MLLTDNPARELRQAAGLTQVELADRLDLPQPRIAERERTGARITVDYLESVAKACGFRIDLVAKRNRQKK